MRLAVLSDFHVLGPGELLQSEDAYRQLGEGLNPIRRTWRRGLYRVRRRLWNTHPELRQTAFQKAIDEIDEYNPEWIIANGDYGGDTGGIGLSDKQTFESVAGAVDMLRQRFAGRIRFIFGDHDLGKYSTVLREGGIRLQSLELGEKMLGIPSFWHEIDDEVHLIGINSSLFTLDLFLPEALTDEIPEWRRLREEHIAKVSHAFDGLPREARVVLFCHDPSALAALGKVPVVLDRLSHIEMTVIGHLHAPSLLKLAKLVPSSRAKKWRPKYPVARILAHSLEGVRSWKLFKPVACPSTFGAGHHMHGGVLFIEKDSHGKLVSARRRIRKK